MKRELRAYAGWELDYRIAFGIADAADPVVKAWKAAGSPELGDVK